MTKTIAKITPLIRLPSQVDVFDYFVPPDLEDKIKIGQLVSIPWRNRYVSGVVLSLGAESRALARDEAKQSSNRDDEIASRRSPKATFARNDKKKFRARPIKKIIEPQPILTPTQLALIKKFSDYYFVAPGSVARLITPARPTRIGQTRAIAIPNQSISFRVAKSQLSLLEQAAKKSLPARGRQTPPYPPLTKGGIKGGLLETQDISSFVWLVFYLIKKQSGFRHPSPAFGELGTGSAVGGSRNDKETLLLLLPTLNLINIFASALKKYQAQMAVIHSGLSRGAYWQAYQKILRGQARIILSTRQGAFLPLAMNLTIVMFDAGSPDFKQYDQHPRYDARHVARWMASLTKSQLILANPSPLQGESLLLPLPSRACPERSEGERIRAPEHVEGVRVVLPTATRQKPAIQLIDMKQKLSSPEFSIVSDEAIEEITKTRSLGKKTIIVALRAEAEQGVSLAKIKDALTKSIKDGITVIPNPRSIGEGGEESPHSDERDPSPPLGVRDDIIVATPALLESGQLLPYRGQIACLVIASIEPLLALPDYRAAERAFYRLKLWQMWAQELAILKIILQSYSPDNLAVRAFAYGEVEHFVQSELENRKRFNYPPFSQLIKLTYQGKDENEINRVAALLKTRERDNIVVRGPYQAHKSEKKSILLKIRPRHAEQRHPEPSPPHQACPERSVRVRGQGRLVSGSVSASDDAQLSVLRTLSFAWAIDRDPENVL